MDGEIALSAKEIAVVMGKSKQAIMKRASKEQWPSLVATGDGKKTKKYLIHALPAEVQIAIYNQENNPALLALLNPAALATVMEQDRTLYNNDSCDVVGSIEGSGKGGNAITSAMRSSALATVKSQECLAAEETSRRAERPELPTTSPATPAFPMQRPDFYAPRHAFEALPEWSPERAPSADALKNQRVGKILAILREVETAPRDWTKGTDAWICFVAKKNEVARQSIYRWLKKYDERGIAGIEHRKSTRDTAKAWTKEALDWWIGLTLQPEHRKIELRALYEDVLLIEAHRRNWQIGGLESARWWHAKKATPAMLAMQKGGLRALDNILPPTLRDYSDLAPFEILVGDQHRWDFWVMDDDTGDVFRPEAYLWQDLRTRLIYGAAFDRRYDAHLCGEALRIGMRIWGLFHAIYTDNGSSELSKYMVGIMAEIRALGAEWKMTEDTPADILDMDGEELNPLAAPIAPGTHKRAIVKNAKAKMIEKTFDILEGILRSRFRLAGSVKRLGDDIHAQDMDHQEAMKLAENGKLLLASEFYLTVYNAIDHYNRDKDHRGVRREWSWRPVPAKPTPMHCLQACYGGGWRPRYISNEAADMIFLRRVDRTVQKGRVELNREWYEHDDIMEMHGERVTVRYNHIETDLALIYQGGKYLCAAHPVEYSSMKDDDLAKRKIMEKRAKRKAVAERFREVTRSVPDLREYSRVPEAERVAAVVGQEKKRIEAMQANLNRTLTAPELAEKVAELEVLNERLPDGRLQATVLAQIGKPAPARPGYFATAADRYLWCVKCEAAGGELSAEDRYFVQEEEAKMRPEERERWQFEREYGT